MTAAISQSLFFLFVGSWRINVSYGVTEKYKNKKL